MYWIGLRWIELIWVGLGWDSAISKKWVNEPIVHLEIVEVACNPSSLYSSSLPFSVASVQPLSSVIFRSGPIISTNAVSASIHTCGFLGGGVSPLGLPLEVSNTQDVVQERWLRHGDSHLQGIHLILLATLRSRVILKDLQQPWGDLGIFCI